MDDDPIHGLDSTNKERDMASDLDGPTIPDPAEATDGSELGEEVGDESLPGTVGFPPTTPSGIGPAGSLTDADHHDSAIERIDREEPESRPPSHDTVRLLDPNAGGEPDVESELVAEAVPPVGLTSPEEEAMHLENDQGTSE